MAAKLATAASASKSVVSHTAWPVSADEAAALVRDAYESDAAVYPQGGGTSLDYGLPANKPGLALSLAKLNSVIDYPSRDMTITVEAGVTLAELALTLAQQRQQFPVDAPQAQQATLGGVVATNTNGPRRYGYGGVRDFVIGVHAVDGRGEAFKGGGRVVKNVAGYDFCKLLTGSLGTLGVITAITLKVRPLAEKRTLAICPVPDLAAAERCLAALAQSRTAPVSIALVGGPAWQAIASKLAIVVILEGTAAEVDWMESQLATELREQQAETTILPDVEADQVWKTLVEFPVAKQGGGPVTERSEVLRLPLPNAPLVLQASLRASGVAAYLQTALAMLPECSFTAYANGVVQVRCQEFPSQGLTRTLVGALQPAAAAALGHVRVLANPTGVEATRQSQWGASDLPLDLMAEIKRQFDPRGILNPGRFVV